MNRNAAAVLTAILLALGCAASENPDTLAVVPFETLGDFDHPELYSHGLPDAVANSLSGREGIVVVERIRLSLLLDEAKLGQAGLVNEKNAPDIGKMLGAKTIILGTIQKSGREVRVQARAVDVLTSRSVFSEKADARIKRFSDFLALEEKIANKIGRHFSAVRGHVGPPTSIEKAFLLYSEGLVKCDQGDNQAGIESFNQALEIDPDFGWADRIRERAEQAFDELDMEILKRKNRAENP